MKDLYIQTCQDLSQQEEALRSKDKDLEQAIAAGTAPIWFSELTKNIENIVKFLWQAGYCCLSVGVCPAPANWYTLFPKPQRF